MPNFVKFFASRVSSSMSASLLQLPLLARMMELPSLVFLTNTEAKPVAQLGKEQNQLGKEQKVREAM